jgi:hypothetical protein
MAPAVTCGLPWPNRSAKTASKPDKVTLFGVFMKHLLVALLACALLFGCQSSSDSAPGNAGDIASGDVTDADAGTAGDIASGDVTDADAGTAEDIASGDVTDADAGTAGDIASGDVTDADAGAAGDVTDADGGTCVPQCTEKVCGDDGCGSVCGTCDAPGTVCEAGQCIPGFACEPDCTDKECGDDGCGETCGDGCEDGETCTEGLCESAEGDITSCEGACGQGSEDMTCNCDTDCWEFGDCCEDVCDFCSEEYVEQCADPCDPSCQEDQECGDDGCGGVCGDGCDVDQACGDDGTCNAIDCFGVDAEEVCPEDTSCALTSEWDALFCYADQEPGQPCSWGLGGCVEGHSCVSDDMTFKTSTCQPATTSLGDECGFSLPACEAGLSCDWVQPDALECLDYAQEGQPCGMGSGTCAEDLACWPDASSDPTGSFCYAAQGLGDVCGWGAGDCGDQLTCMWDEAEDTDNVPHCYPATIEAGGACGDGIGGCASWLTCTPDVGGASSTCTTMGLPGDECGDGIAECASSISACILLTEDSEDAMCMALRWPGDTCGIGVGFCLDGLVCIATEDDPNLGICEDECEFNAQYDDGVCDDDCWMPDADCFCIPDCDGKNCGADGCGGTCGAECAEGEACYWGLCEIASCLIDPSICGEASGCVINESYTAFQCMEFVGEGEECFLGNGDCADGLVCQETEAGTGDYLCVGQGAEDGEACGYGDPACVDGTKCAWTAFEEATCVAIPPQPPELELGDECLDEGLGKCPEGTDCTWTDKTETEALCMAADQEAGELCWWGLGGCTEGNSCVYGSEAETDAQCYANELQAGEFCGEYAQAGCAPSLECVPTSENSLESTCIALATPGEACGYGVGYCWGTSCLPETPGSESTICTLNAFLDQPCGEGIAGCFGNLECIPDGQGQSFCEDACAYFDTYGDGSCDENCLWFDFDDCQ